MNHEHKQRILNAVSARAWSLDLAARQAEAARNPVVAEDRRQHANQIWEAYDALVSHWLGLDEEPAPRLTEAQWRDRDH